MRPAARLASLALSGVLSAACGGAGGDAKGGPTVTLLATQDATLLTTSPGSVQGDPGLKVGQFIGIGMVAGLRFDLSPVLAPPTVVLSARLRLRQVSVSGVPYTNDGKVVVDRVDFEAGIGAGSHTAPALASAVDTLSADAGTGIKEADVTSVVAAAAAAGQRGVYFLLRFDALVLSPALDWASFEDAAGGLGTADVPELIVTYR